MRLGIVWAEMARRKVQFHKNTDWDKIGCWGLFRRSDVQRLLNDGRLRVSHNLPGVIWVTPSKEIWETKIKPLIDNHSLVELSKMAGW